MTLDIRGQESSIKEASLPIVQRGFYPSIAMKR